MDQLHEADEAIDKLLTEADHFERVVGPEGISPDRVELALSVAKRVRRASTLCVQALARTRDQLQP
jgi:hypothetical protein